MELTKAELEILDHTLHRAANNLFCGEPDEMISLVNAGLMEFAGKKSFVPDPYYRITAAGRNALRELSKEPQA